MLLEELLSNVDLAIPYPQTTFMKMDIQSVAYKTEQIGASCLFICFNSELPAHFSADVVALVVEEQNIQHYVGVSLPVIVVHSCRRALAHIYHNFCGAPCDKLTIIGVTGTNGKTSTATMIRHILANSGYNTALIGTVSCLIGNTPYEAETADGQKRLITMTTPDPDILYPFFQKAVEAGVTHVIMEVSSHALALEKVSPITFAEGIFTNLTPEHLDFHQTLEVYKDAKRKLFLQCKHAIINIDDTFGKELAKELNLSTTTCGCLWQGDATASHVKLTEKNTSYFYRFGGITNIVRMELPGAFQVYNSLLAITCAIHLGVAPHLAISAMTNCKGALGRLEAIANNADISVYIDFAHTEFALSNLLTTVRQFAKGRIILVFGCGGDRDPSKRGPMGACAAKYADFTYITSDNCRTESIEKIISQILAGHTCKEKRTVVLNRKEAIKRAILEAQCGDTILLVGKGHEQYEIVGTELQPFDERSIALEALSLRRSYAH